MRRNILPLAFACLALSAAGCHDTKAASSSGAAARSVAAQDASNPLLGSWTVAPGADCPELGADFTAGHMVMHHGGGHAYGPSDTGADVDYEVREGMVIAHDRTDPVNAPTFIFQGPDEIRLGGTQGSCVFQRAR